MTNLERYVIDEHVEDFNYGYISRRELLRRVTLISGSTAATLAVLALVGCDLTQPQRAPSSPQPAASGSVSAAYATPPPSKTTTGVTVSLDDPRIKAEPVTVSAADGAGLIGYRARPNRDGRVPGILVVDENAGLLEHFRDVCRRLATAGFASITVDLLSRQGGAERLEDGAAYAAELGKRPVAQLVADLRAALDNLKAQPFVAADRLGALGFCFGGGMVWSVLTAGIDLKAAVPYYGPRPSDADRLASTRAAVFAVYAEKDSFVTPSAANIEEQLKKSGRPYQITIYPGAQHAFYNDTKGDRYAPEQAQQAWVATIEWFRKYLS